MENLNYRGDTFWRTYKIRYNNVSYTFHSGDKVIAAFVNNGVKYLKKEVTLNEDSDSITIEWSAEDMKSLRCDEKYILEVEFTTQNFVKTYQEKIDIKRDFII